MSAGLTLPTGWLIQVNTIAGEKSNQVTLVLSLRMTTADDGIAMMA